VYGGLSVAKYAENSHSNGTAGKESWRMHLERVCRVRGKRVWRVWRKRVWKVRRKRV